MTTATLTSKGQITIPATVRAALGVDAGDRVEFVEIAAGRYEVIAATRSVTALKGHVRQGPQDRLDRGDECGKSPGAARRPRRRVNDPSQHMTGLDTNVLVAVHHAGRCRAVGRGEPVAGILDRRSPPASFPWWPPWNWPGYCPPPMNSTDANWSMPSKPCCAPRKSSVEGAEVVWKALRLFASSNARLRGLPHRALRRRRRMQPNDDLRPRGGEGLRHDLSRLSAAADG